METELAVFALGAVFAVALQLFISRLTLEREKRKEAWIRKLNSYENFYRAMTGLIDLVSAGVRVPEQQFWEAMVDARKSAYDAASYDAENPERTARMRQLTLDLVLAYQGGELDGERLRELREETEAIRSGFYSEERAALPRGRG
ncbi:MAG: hypothetical protein M3340_03225 [Actinomycetota bacterium]|nr:hypothetical protein [Actinomycetota bacterium]